MRRSPRSTGLTYGVARFAAWPIRRRRSAPETGFNLAARLLGSYEAELHEIIERVVADGYETILDVGSGDGYYTVGLARRLPQATVEAFDPDPAARRLCNALADVNGVLDRVEIRDGATADTLRRRRDGRTFVKVDCDGCEVELLWPADSELLQSSAVLVRAPRLPAARHDGAGARPVRAEHVAEIVERTVRSNDDYAELAALDERDAEVILSERRPESLRWALLTPSA